MKFTCSIAVKSYRKIIVVYYSPVPNNSTGTFIFFNQKGAPVRAYLGAIFILFFQIWSGGTFILTGTFISKSLMLIAYTEGAFLYCSIKQQYKPIMYQ